jgi:hypothetical protein
MTSKIRIATTTFSKPTTYMSIDNFIDVYVPPINRLARKEMVKFNVDYDVFTPSSKIDELERSVFMDTESFDACFESSIVISFTDDTYSDELSSKEVTAMVIMPLDCAKWEYLKPVGTKERDKNYLFFGLGRPVIRLEPTSMDIVTAYMLSHVLRIARKTAEQLAEKTMGIGYIVIPREYCEEELKTYWDLRSKIMRMLNVSHNEKEEECQLH